MQPTFPVFLLVHFGIAPEVLDRCFETGVLVERDPGNAGFNCAVTRRRTAEAVPWGRRRCLHRRLATAIEATGGSPNEAAEHYAAAHAYPEARCAWIGFADAACAQKRYGEALAAFRKALEIWPAGEDDPERGRVLQELARCAENEDVLGAAEMAWTELFERAVEEDDLELGIRACHRLADFGRRRCDPVAVRKQLTAAADLAERAGDCEAIAGTRFALAGFLTDRIRLHDALEEIERAERASERTGKPELLSQIMGFHGLLLAMLGRSGEAHRVVDDSLRLALEANSIEAAATAYRRLANLRDYAADYPGERDAQLRAIAFCRSKGVSTGVHSCLSCLSYAFFRTGQWKRALHTAQEVLAARDSHPSLRATALLVRGLITTFRGERRHADALIDEALQGLRRENFVGMEFFALWARATLAEVDGRVADAAAVYTHIRFLWEETEDLHDVLPALIGASCFYARQHQLDALRECVDILNRISARSDTPEVRSVGRVAQGEAARIEGDRAMAIRLMRQAVDDYQQVGAPVEQALVRHRLSLVLAEGAHFEEALRWRREAQRIAERLGMRLILEKLEKEFPAGLAGTVEPLPTGGLTERQRDVLRLMSKGLTNKEIAARFSLSPRTVEMHVANMLQRLHCRTRAQATRKAAELGIVDSS